MEVVGCAGDGANKWRWCLLGRMSRGNLAFFVTAVMAYGDEDWLMQCRREARAFATVDGCYNQDSFLYQFICSVYAHDEAIYRAIRAMASDILDAGGLTD